MNASHDMLSRLRSGERQTLPSFLQAEAAECGLAALAMIAVYHGHDLDLQGLRQRFPSSLKGTPLPRLMAMATELGFTPRPLRLDMEHLGQLATPCVLHWDLDHYVVLKRVTKEGIEVHDPATGVRFHSFADASKHFTGVALELTPRKDFEPVQARTAISLRSMVGTVHGIGRALSTVLGLALAVEVLMLLTPWYSQWVMDQVIVTADHSLLTLLVVAFAFVTVFQVAVTAARAWSVTWLSNSLYAQWVTNVFAHLLRLPMDWFAKRHVGDIVSRFSSLQSIQQTVTTSFTTTLLDGVFALAVLGLMFAYNVTMAAVVVGVFVAYATARWFLFAPLRRAQEEQLVFGAKQQSEMLETVRAIQAVKLANKGATRLSRYANATVSTLNRGIAVQRYKIAFEAINQGLFGLLRIGVLALGARAVLEGHFTVGMLVAFTTYADQFVSRAAGLIDKGVELRMLRLHAERIADVVAAAPEAHLEGTGTWPELEPAIELRNVSFRYAEGEPWVLRHCSLTIRASESVAIVGPSGGGKTTLAKILLGLVQPTEGQVLFGGVDIRRIGLERYRELTAAVMQDDTLVAGTISDNISFFDAGAKPLQVELVARAAAVHEDIVRMPMGYYTLVGDMGSALSGGQKQRVLVARALYRAPKLLVMDEATSHLDVHCERAINHAVSLSGATRVIIAHRPETIAAADRIVAIRDGAAVDAVDAKEAIRPVELLRVATSAAEISAA